MLASARAEFGTLDVQPLAFTAQALTLYRTPRPGEVYEAFESAPFQNEARS